jgi:hypothetical protein
VSAANAPSSGSAVQVQSYASAPLASSFSRASSTRAPGKPSWADVTEGSRLRSPPLPETTAMELRRGLEEVISCPSVRNSLLFVSKIFAFVASSEASLETAPSSAPPPSSYIAVSIDPTSVRCPPSARTNSPAPEAVLPVTAPSRCVSPSVPPQAPSTVVDAPFAPVSTRSGSPSVHISPVRESVLPATPPSPPDDFEEVVASRRGRASVSSDDASVLGKREATLSPVSPNKFDVLANADPDTHPPVPRTLRSRAHRSRVGSSSRPNTSSDA